MSYDRDRYKWAGWSLNFKLEELANEFNEKKESLYIELLDICLHDLIFKEKDALENSSLEIQMFTALKILTTNIKRRNDPQGEEGLPNPVEEFDFVKIEGIENE